MFSHVICFSYLFGHVTVDYLYVICLLFATFLPGLHLIFYFCTVFTCFLLICFHSSLRVSAQTLLMIFVNFATVLETVCFYIIYGIYSI